MAGLVAGSGFARTAIAVTFFMLSASAGVRAAPVDLTALDVFVRPGFQNEWAYRLPDPGNQSWKRVPAKPGNRPLVMSSLGLEGMPKPVFFPLIRYKPEKFCVVTEFTAGSELLDSSSGVGLYLAQIGQNWDVYVNGTMVATESYLDKDGLMLRERAVRGALITIDKRYLILGKNVLAFRVIGDPVDARTGLFVGGPYLVGPYAELKAVKQEYADLMLIGIYFFFAVYHMLLFLLRPKSISYLLYGIGAFLLSVFFLCRTYIIFDLVPDTSLIRSVELASLLLLFPVFIAFFDSVLQRKFTRFTAIGFTVSLVLAIVQFFFLREAVLRIWQFGLPILLGYLVVFDMARPLSKKMKHYLRSTGSRGAAVVLAAIGRTFARSDAGRLFLALVVVSATVLLDAFGIGGTSFSKYGFFLLIIGTAAMLASQFVKIYHDIEKLNVTLERRVEDRTKDLEAIMSEETELSEKLTATNAKLQSAAEAGARDMRMAVQVQQGFFPKSVPDIDGWDIGYTFMPASGVSGDFFDFYVEGRSLRGLLLGDVSGHGIASGLITVLARSVFYRVVDANQNATLGRVMELINEELVLELAMVENYMTAVLLRVRDDVVEYTNAAHPDAFYKRAGRPKVSVLRPKDEDYKGAIMGREGFESPYKTIRFRMEPGDSMLLYTDCLNESKNVDGEMFGDDGVAQAFSSAPEGSAQHMLDFLMQEWRFHISGARVADDLTAILLKKT